MKTAPKTRWFITLLPIIALFSLSACSSTAGGGKEIDVPIEITRGMEAADLIAALGEPDEIRDLTQPTPGAEIWVYRRVEENVALIVSGTVETPGMDVGGVQMTITDNVYTPATTREVEETLFLMVDGVIAAWRVDRELKQHLN